MATLEKVMNFRQAGGLQLVGDSGAKVKDGILYRSATLDSATQADTAFLKELNIKSVIDLRGPAEFSKKKNKPIEDMYTPLFLKNGLAREQSPPKASHVGYLYVVDMLSKSYGRHVTKQVNVFLQFVSLFLYAIDFVFGTNLTLQFYVKHVLNKMEVWEHYIDVLEYSKPQVAEVLRVVCDPCNLPALIHCELGKDRTGYIIALILNCLGVDDEIIIQDYARTEKELQPRIEKIEDSMRRKLGTEDRYCHANADTMRQVLSELRKRYGTVSQYIVSTGFSIQEQRKLREGLLEGYE